MGSPGSPVFRQTHTQRTQNRDRHGKAIKTIARKMLYKVYMNAYYRHICVCFVFSDIKNIKHRFLWQTGRPATNGVLIFLISVNISFLDLASANPSYSLMMFPAFCQSPSKIEDVPLQTPIYGGFFPLNPHLLEDFLPRLTWPRRHGATRERNFCHCCWVL